MTTRLFTRLGAVVLAGAMLTAACSSKSNDNNDASGSNDTSASSSVKGLTVDYAKLTGTLTAGGSTFQNAFQETARGAFSSVAAGLTINYDGQAGSGGGKNQLLNNPQFDFAGSDSTLNDAEKALLNNRTALYFPVVAAPLAIVFHVGTNHSLQFSADTLAKIFQRQITKWDDPAIKAENTTATLPSTDIVVVHRDSGSGSTNNFTGFLKAAAPSVWTLGRGDTVAWPADEQPAKGSGGIAQLVAQKDGSIGYVDFADAKNTSGIYMAKVKNAAGKYVAPSLAGVSAALSATTLNADLTFDPLNATGDATYPIAVPTYMIVFKTQPAKVRGDAVKGYLNFIYTDGQALAAQANFTKLPDSYRTKAIQQLKTLVVPTA
jgi:phosphate transport system substrate-binding protein